MPDQNDIGQIVVATLRKLTSRKFILPLAAIVIMLVTDMDWEKAMALATASVGYSLAEGYVDAARSKNGK